jgi:hypothetical protein
MPRPRKSTKKKVTTAKTPAEDTLTEDTPKTLRTYRTKTEEDSTPKPASKGQMTTVVEEEFYNACKQNLTLGGQRFVPGATIPKEFLTEASKDFYLQGGHIASRKKLRTVRLK